MPQEPTKKLPTGPPALEAPFFGTPKRDWNIHAARITAAAPKTMPTPIQIFR
jgi:hypothetical protein